MASTDLEDAIREVDVEGVRAFCQQSKSDPPMQLRKFIYEEWWRQVDNSRSRGNLELEKKFVRILEILKHHHYVVSSPDWPYDGFHLFYNSHYGLAKAYLELFHPTTHVCGNISLAFTELSYALKTKQPDDKVSAAVDAFVKHCSRLSTECTVPDLDFYERASSPLLEKAIGKYFPNPALYAEREPYLSLAEAIEDHDQGVQSTHVRDPISKHLTDSFMKRDIAGYIGDYSVEHSPPSRKAKRQRQKSSSPDSVEPMAWRGGCSYSKKQKRKVGGKRSRQKKRPRRYTRKHPPAQGQVLEQVQPNQGPGFVDNVKTGVGYGIGLTVGEGIANAAGNALFGSNEE